MPVCVSVSPAMVDDAESSIGRESGPLWIPIMLALETAASFACAAMLVIGFPVRIRNVTVGIGSGRLGGGGAATVGFTDVSTRAHLPL
jgi:hypothetical protein